jgi:hypothetical protein
LVALIFGAVTWFTAPTLRGRVEASILEMQEYRAANKATSIGDHVAFLKEAWVIIASASVLGHGTGSIASNLEAWLRERLASRRRLP